MHVDSVRPMNVVFITFGITLVQLASSLKVYSWHRQWNIDVQEKEFACVDSDRKSILHSSLKGVSGHYAVISHHDYSFSNTEFSNTNITIDNGDKFVLETSFPGDLGPNNISSVREFCDVTDDFIFFLRPVGAVSGFKKVKLQGLFKRFVLGVSAEFEGKVFGN